MSLASFFDKTRPALAARWADAADAAYPFASAGFLRTSTDTFANPVGARSRELSDVLCAAVIGVPHDGKTLRAALEEFVRVRAMQDAPAETALQVMFACKTIFRDCIREHTLSLDDAMRAELEAMDTRCDALALLAFGLYARSREAFFNARLDDMRRRNVQIMRLARKHGLAVEEEDGATGT